MKTAFKKLSSLIFVVLMMIAVIPVFGALPPSTPPPDNIALWIQPTNINLTTANPAHVVGYKFNVTVWAKANVETKGWQIWLIYANASLDATGAWYCLADGTGDPFGPSEFMKTTGMATMPVTPNFVGHDATHERVEFGEAWASGKNNSAKTGRCAIIEFTVTDVPKKGQTLESWLDISSQAGPLPLDKTWILMPDATHIYVAYDALYGFKWAIPPGPELAVDPAIEFYDRYTEWNGTLCTPPESIKLKSLAQAWYLTNVSFTLNFNTAELEITNIVKNTADWDVALTVDNTTTPGQVVTYAETSKTLSGDVTIITITFRILDQELYPTVEHNMLTFSDVEMFDHTLEIIPSKITPGEKTVEGFLAVAMPWMQVKPKDSVLGDNMTFLKHTTFQIEVTINRLHFAWSLIGLEFRLLYDPTLLQVVDVEEGPYLGNYAPFGTWFKYFIEPNYYGPHILVGNLIYPNFTDGKWKPPFPGAEEGKPGENGTIAIITFEIIEQLPEPDYVTGTFELFKIRMVDPTCMLIPVDENRVVNGTYKCFGFPWAGRQIDLYGGAHNAGYGSIPFPEPFGGQGPNQPMDLVIPQSEVHLFVDLKYNWWPVQQKDVSFEVEGPYEHLFNATSQQWYYVKRQNWFVLLKETGRTDEDGVATISFAMPWPCVDPEALLGVWKVTATANVRDVIIIDTMYFYYDYMVHIWKVTTDKYYYHHSEEVEITVEYGSHAMQEYPGLFAAVIKDELNVVIGIDLAEVTLGGARFCEYANDTLALYIQIEKWAFAGLADILVNCFDKDPTVGGFAWTPQAFEDDIIYILPN